MKSIVQQAAPNVVSGVNFNEDRFNELFAWMSAVASDSVQVLLLPFRYGLVLPFDGKTALDLQKIGNKIVVNRCSGITSKGSVIGVFENLTPVLQQDLPSTLNKEVNHYINVIAK